MRPAEPPKPLSSLATDQRLVNFVSSLAHTYHRHTSTKRQLPKALWKHLPNERLSRQRLLVCKSEANTEGAYSVSQTTQLQTWLSDVHGLHRQHLKLQLSAGLYSSTEQFRATQDVKEGEVIVALPSVLGITATDAHCEPGLAELTSGRSELVCLALWLMHERAKGTNSAWHPFLQSLPGKTETPVLWSESERRELLRGSPTADEAGARASALDAEWDSLRSTLSTSQESTDSGIFTRDAFMEAMSVVFAHAAFLDSAQCFALLPFVTLLEKTGRQNEALLDFNLDSQMATLVAGRSFAKGEAVQMYDGRPNGELFLATGTVEDRNPADCLTLSASLVKADRLFSAKNAILESLGMSAEEVFPIYEDRMPLQLLAFLRLSRVQDPAQLALVSFERDTVVSQNNEYEILQLMLGDCRERLSMYPGTIEDYVKKLQRRDLSNRERLATRLLLSEQRILQGTVDAVRRKLAPIRGIPTKSGGMADPNEDLKDIFATIESIPEAPGKLLGGLMSWARGEQDPTWRKNRKSSPRQRP